MKIKLDSNSPNGRKTGIASFLAKYLVQKCEPWVNVLDETFKAEGLSC